ncbi:MAG: YncE family protein [Candidatus Kapaibacterium sp.]
MKTKLLFVLLLLLIVSCADDSRVVDNNDARNSMLLSYENPDPRIGWFSFSEKKISGPDPYFEANGSYIQGTVTEIRYFNNRYYMLVPEHSKIVITDKDFAHIADISFADEGYKPIGICFPNATDAWVIHEGIARISVIDITVNEKALEIALSAAPSSIACLGNTVVTANTGDNSLSIVRSNTLAEEAVIPVSPEPFKADITPDGEKIFYVCRGAGKTVNQQGAKTDAMIGYISINSGSIIKEIPLGTGIIPAIDEFPLDYTITSNNLAFVITENVLYRVNLKYNSDPVFLGRLRYDRIYFNFMTGKLVLYSNKESGTELYINNDATGSVDDLYRLDQRINAIYPVF